MAQQARCQASTSLRYIESLQKLWQSRPQYQEGKQRNERRKQDVRKKHFMAQETDTNTESGNNNYLCNMQTERQKKQKMLHH